MKRIFSSVWVGYRRKIENLRKKTLDFFSGLCIHKPRREAKRGHFLPEQESPFFEPSYLWERNLSKTTFLATILGLRRHFY